MHCCKTPQSAVRSFQTIILFVGAELQQLTYWLCALFSFRKRVFPHAATFCAYMYYVRYHPFSGLFLSELPCHRSSTVVHAFFVLFH